MTDRLDRVMVDRGLARSRGQARELLDAGSVTVDDQVVRRPSTPVTPDEVVTVQGRDPWVGRGAHKLVAALELFAPGGLRVAGTRCIDVGASTGGFTQVLLHHGAREVVALDVGHGQLAAPVAQDPRVIERSGTSVRGLTAKAIGGPVDLLVADLSFISLTVVMGDLVGLLAPDAEMVLLVKPQFEVGRERLGRGGVVRAPVNRALALRAVVASAREHGLGVQQLAVSPVVGGTGNLEYLLWLSASPGQLQGWEAVDQQIDVLSTHVPEAHP